MCQVAQGICEKKKKHTVQCFTETMSNDNMMKIEYIRRKGLLMSSCDSFNNAETIMDIQAPENAVQYAENSNNTSVQT